MRATNKPFLPDGSRVRRESHARFCERPAVKFHRPTLPHVSGKNRHGVYIRCGGRRSPSASERSCRRSSSSSDGACTIRRRRLGTGSSRSSKLLQLPRGTREPRQPQGFSREGDSVLAMDLASPGAEKPNQLGPHASPGGPVAPPTACAPSLS
jgi:hypothetical protein